MINCEHVRKTTTRIQTCCFLSLLPHSYSWKMARNHIIKSNPIFNEPRFTPRLRFRIKRTSSLGDDVSLLFGRMCQYGVWSTIEDSLGSRRQRTERSANNQDFSDPLHTQPGVGTCSENMGTPWRVLLAVDPILGCDSR